MNFAAIAVCQAFEKFGKGALGSMMTIYEG
jgi:hypothetical protein